MKLIKKVLKSANCYPEWLDKAMAYETLFGSIAFGTDTKDSDIDIHGFCVPPAELLFSQCAGYIEGFGPKFKPCIMLIYSYLVRNMT